MLPFAIGAGVLSMGATLIAAYKKGEISEAEYKRAMAAADELERKLKTMRPDETWENIDPQLLSEAAKYSPDIAAFVQENAPQLIQEAESATEKRVQREALQKLAAQAETGRDVISEAQREEALFEVEANAKARRDRLMEALRRQGMLGSGEALVAQLQGEEDASRRARQESLRGVQEAEMRRRQALGQAASLAGQIRGQNVKVESANVGTMNTYNQRLANARNLYNQYASGERNRAQELNQQRQRETEKYNLGLSNEYAMYNRRQQQAAKERARQFDVDLANRMFDVRQGAEGRRAQGKREFIGDVGTSITSGIGTGLSAASMLDGLATNASKRSYYDSFKRGAGQAMGKTAVGTVLRPTSAEEIEIRPTRSVFSLAQEPQFMEDREQEDLVRIGYAEPEAFGPIRPRKRWTEEEI